MKLIQNFLFEFRAFCPQYVIYKSNGQCCLTNFLQSENHNQKEWIKKCRFSQWTTVKNKFYSKEYWRTLSFQ